MRGRGEMLPPVGWDFENCSGCVDGGKSSKNQTNKIIKPCIKTTRQLGLLTVLIGTDGRENSNKL